MRGATAHCQAALFAHPLAIHECTPLLSRRHLELDHRNEEEREPGAGPGARDPIPIRWVHGFAPSQIGGGTSPLARKQRERYGPQQAPTKRAIEDTLEHALRLPMMRRRVVRESDEMNRRKPGMAAARDCTGSEIYLRPACSTEADQSSRRRPTNLVTRARSVPLMVFSGRYMRHQRRRRMSASRQFRRNKQTLVGSARRSLWCQ